MPKNPENVQCAYGLRRLSTGKIEKYSIVKLKLDIMCKALNTHLKHDKFEVIPITRLRRVQ